MKKYVVALISFFDNEIKQFEVNSIDEFSAIKKAMVKFTNDEFKQSEIDYQNSEDYPKNINELETLFSNCEMDFSVIEILKEK